MPSNAQVQQIYVDLVARTAEFEKAIGKVNAMTRQVAQETRRNMEEARGSIALLGEEMGVRLPRHLRSFVSELPGVATAMSAAFNAVAVFALIGIVVEAGKKLEEFIKKNEEAGRKSRDAWQGAIQPITDTNDKLELTKTKLDNAIAKLEHKPQNKVKEAIEEATVAADELGRHLEGDIAKIASALKLQQHGEFAQLFLHQTGANDATEIAKDAQDKFNQIAAGTFKSSSGDQTKDRDAVIQAALEEAYKKLGPAQKEADRITANFGGKAPDTSSSVQEVKTLTELIAGLKGLQTESALTQAIDKDKSTVGVLQGNKDANLDLIKDLEDGLKKREIAHGKSIEEEYTYWRKYLRTFAEGSEQWLQVQEKFQTAQDAITKTLGEKSRLKKPLDEYNDTQSKVAPIFGKDDGRGDDALASTISKAAIEQGKLNGELILALDHYNLMTGAITAHDAALDAASVHAQEYAASLQALQAEMKELKQNDSLGIDKENQAKQIGLQSQIDALNIRAQIQSAEDAQNELSTSWKGMIDGVFDEMVRKSNETSEQIRNVARTTVDGINSEIVKAMTGQKFDFSKVFLNSAQGLAKSGLEKLEGVGLKALGFGGGKRDGSSAANALFVTGGGGSDPSGLEAIFGKAKLPNVIGPSGQSSSLVNAGTKGLLGMLNNSNWASSLFGGKLFGAGGLFGGHFAAGGDVMGGVPIDVGELGPERFVPYTSGKIVPNNQINRDGGSVHIGQITGSDPVQTQQAVLVGMRIAHAQAVRDSTHMMHERAKRVPH